MAARARTRPRTARADTSSRGRKRKSRFSLAKFNRPGIVGPVAILAVLAAAAIAFDGAEVGRSARDWLLRTFGFGLLVVLAWALYGASVIFGLTHLPINYLVFTSRDWREAWLTLLTFQMGFGAVLAFAYQRTRNVMPVAVLHALLDAL